MLEASIDALYSLFQPMSILGLLAGILFGIVSGALPGGGLHGMVILLSFAFQIDPVVLLPIAMGMMAVTATSDTIPAILLGIPGDTAAQATILDGYQLARQGRAGEALGAAYTSSLIGGFVGVAALWVTIPIARIFINAFSSAEFFMLSFLGIVVVGIVSSGAVIKGLLAGALGLGISFIGFDEVSGIPRLTFDIQYLWDGIPVTAVVIGLFAIPEMIDLVAGDNTNFWNKNNNMIEQSNKGRWTGIKHALNNKFLIFRASLLGVLVGIMPGIGGSVANWLAYGQAAITEKGASKTFGTGDIRGVIAPESANNAVDGASLIPTLTFGVPGSVKTSLLLAIFFIIGLQPGPSMLNENLDMTMLIILSLLFANIIAVIIVLFFTPQIAKVCFVRPHVLAPVTIGLLLLVGYNSRASMGDLFLIMAFAVLGWVMKVAKWPRPPIIIALVLGPILEKYLYISVSTYGWAMFMRPIVWIIAVVAFLMVFLFMKGQNNVKGELGKK